MSTLKLAIIDDEAAPRELLVRLVAAWSEQRSSEVSISPYDGADAFRFALADAGAFDILLLDVQMPGMDGMELARTLRAEGCTSQIIFVSGFAEWLPQGYDVDALNYLIKPVKPTQLFAALDKAAERVNRQPRYVLLETDGELKRCNVESVVYAEAFSHYLELHTESGVITLRMSMAALEKLLGEGFLRPHRSYLAAVRHITGISRTEITMADGAKLPLSRAMRDAANEAFIKYNWRDE